MAVDPKIKDICLNRYINHCRILNQIAFFQWRLLFPNKLTKYNQVEELIGKALNEFIKKTNKDGAPLYSTVTAAQNPKNIY